MKIQKSWNNLKEVTEAELQEIRGGDKRLPYFFKHLFQIGQSSNIIG